MDDSDLECLLSDTEMLDDAPEDANPVAFAPSLPVAHIISEDVVSHQARRTEPAVTIANHDECLQLNSSDNTCGDENRLASPHVDSPFNPLRGCQSDISNEKARSGSNILAKIEGIFGAMLDVLLNERGQLSVAIMTRPQSQRQQFDSTIASQTHTESVQHIQFPGKTEKEAWRFGECRVDSVCHCGTDTAQLS